MERPKQIIIGKSSPLKAHIDRENDVEISLGSHHTHLGDSRTVWLNSKQIRRFARRLLKMADWIDWFKVDEMSVGK